ncbi:MAG: ATP-dependent metallopeptidase FtsH/Yme1/Tma family protein [Candidatus Acidiferrales bacterium]
MPGQSSKPGTLPLARTLLFVSLMVALALILWKTHSSNSGTTEHPASMSYAELMNQVDQNNIASAQVALAQNTAELRGTLRQPPQDFDVTIPRDVLPDLAERLRKQGVSIQVTGQRQDDLRRFLFNFAILPLVVIFWIFMMYRARAKKSPAPNAPANRPLG